MKRLMIFACAIALISTVQAEPAWTISGTVLVGKEGVLYIHLVDEEQFAVPFTGIREIKMDLTPSQIEIGEVAFSFENVPAGRYGVRVYIDRNDNGRLDPADAILHCWGRPPEKTTLWASLEMETLTVEHARYAN